MSKPAVKPIPEAMHSITPHLVCKGAADAIHFYEKAFGAVEMFRLPGPGGTLAHAMVRIGNSMLMPVDEVPQMGALGPKMIGGSPVTIHLSVATQVRDLSPQEIEAAMHAQFGAPGQGACA